ncbi:MAG: DUF2218 domain-containing protein [Burkholderiales bacterium]|jgi:hypothetical protein|nr:DUF2218 domain-containing protein [Burkholderiales bacterium]MCX7204373.1 DUF2218 domain-containing protein [Pseudomonadota bacterium]
MFNSYTQHTTSDVEKVLYKLCKHFALKIPVEFDSEKAHIEFTMGICQIRREQDTLHLQCQADASDKLTAIESIVEDHLGLMVKNPELVLQWQALVEPCQS